MIYLDEEVREKFHKTNVTMQVILSIFEHEIAKWHLQVEVIDVLFPHQVLVGVPKIREEAALLAAEKINSLYKRKDRMQTCEVCQLEYGTFLFYVTDSSSFAHPM